MYINGTWFAGADGIMRPVLWGQVRTGTGGWVAVPFLVDTGADRTVFSAGVLGLLHLVPLTTSERLGGLGGIVSSVVINTHVRFPQVGGGPITLRGLYAAVTVPEALDMSVLGRDITGLFAVIVDQPGQVVCLLGQRHRYYIASL
jgi:hypothetical protein